MEISKCCKILGRRVHLATDSCPLEAPMLLKTSSHWDIVRHCLHNVLANPFGFRRDALLNDPGNALLGANLFGNRLLNNPGGLGANSLGLVVALLFGDGPQLTL